MSPAPTAARDLLAAAAETVALVLEDNSPLPETSTDVADLAAQLRGHISQLAVALPAGDPVAIRAQTLGSTAVPDGYVSSRVHLMHLAEATQSVITAVRGRGPFAWPASRLPGQWPKRPSRNTVRVLVFALALITLVVAASVPRT
ncbi:MULTISPECIES: DUF6415 family natural product biosynthesis protein [Streptomyces]|uniref:Uncharacterized protein n=1 Tax=Streptomyces canarius TaxID=285453 RepID=A0ABQ3D0M2_9ACTN|nr:DUF6415 family natural product biosynthesis protein [Streptomyces canarius]GHA51697.1 hypothetical protein GCM10010345_65330 [Streptomyces canarius]